MTSTAPPSESLQELESRLQQTWETVLQPGYHVKTAKQLATTSAERRPSWRTTGEYGHQWGTAVHELLDIKLQHPDSDLRRPARRLIEQFELGYQRLDELLQTVESVVNSGLWSRAHRAKKFYSEVPIELASTEDGCPVINRGVIDLCFLESDGWVIVDYKTDDITESDLEKAFEFYMPQLQVYADFWQNITNEKVVELGLYFSKIHHFHASFP